MNYLSDSDQQLGDLVARIIAGGQLTQDRLAHSLHSIELSPIKFWALNYLATAGEPLALSEIAERCHCARSNATQLIDRLEAEGLVNRIHDPHDRRMVRAELTPAGRRRFEEGIALLAEPIQELRDMFDPAEREQLATLLARVCDRWA